MRLDLMPGIDQVYFSTDTSAEEPDLLAVDVIDNDAAELNNHNPAQLPPHRLELRIGAVVMLLRNVNVQQGLCNGTRMVITELHVHSIRCRIMSESSRMFNREIDLVRFKFEYDARQQNRNDDIHFYRTQFPI